MTDHETRFPAPRVSKDRGALPLNTTGRRHPIGFAFETSANPVMQDALTTIKRISVSHVNVLLT
jgi:hypothetical protein